MSKDICKILDELRRPFHPSQISWKPGAVKGERAMALAYADLRTYMNRLDEVCGPDWSVAYEPWGEDRIICRLTICGVTRSSTGEMSAQDEKNEMGGTVAESQAFKRAAVMFGLSRYLYTWPTGWADYDPKTRQFTDKAKAKLTGLLVQHYRRANESKGELADMFASPADAADAPATGETSEQRDPNAAALLEPFNALGVELYGDQWPAVRERNTRRVSIGRTAYFDELKAEELQALINGMTTIQNNRNGTSVTA